MKTRRACFQAALAALLAVSQLPGTSQGLSQNQLKGLVERTIGDVRFWTPPDFVIERVTPATRTDSYVAMTFDSRGRLAVSKEADFPRLLLDKDGDGVLESERVVSEHVRDCQGLWFDGPALHGACAMADPNAPRVRGGNAAPAGIFRMEDTDGDDVADTFETLAIAGTMGEHGPHAIRRSASGTWMVMMGNAATIFDPYLDFTSPVLRNVDGQFLPYMPIGGRSDRQGVHSGLFEWDGAQRKFRVFSGGNRNTYDFAFNLAGEAFLFDSDHESDIGLMWYRPVRTLHHVLNGDYGYRDGSGRYPTYYIDSLPAARDVGRGSPVGVETYQSYAYPAEYFDNLLEADWSRGRILYTALTPNGATYAGRSDLPEIVHGEPLNVTDLEVGPDGMLYFSTGGRNTHGGVYRLRYTGARPSPPDLTGILAAVRQAQPLSSWGWAAIERVKATMGETVFGAELERLARNTNAAAPDRARSLYELQRHGPAPGAALLAALAADASAEVRAAVMFMAGFQRAGAVRATAAAGLKDIDPVVRRRAAEALMRLGQSPDRRSLAPVEDIYALLADRDRFVRWAGRILLEYTPRATWEARALADDNPASAPEALVAWARTADPVRESNRVPNLQAGLERQLTLMQQVDWPADDLLRLYRAFMLTTSLMRGAAGHSAASRARIHAAVTSRFPSNDERLNREVAQLIAYAGQPGAIDQLLDAMPKGNTNQELTMHYLYALRAITAGWTIDQKERLAEVLGRTSRWRGGHSYASVLALYFEAFDPLYAAPEEKAMLYARAPDFAPLTQAELAAPVAGRGGGGGGRGAPAPVVRRTANRQMNKGEMFDEVIYTPRTEQPNVEAGRAIFEASCASCHRIGGVGNNHGVAALDLTAPARTVRRRDLLESIMFPSRQVPPDLRSTIVTLNSGDTVRGLVVRETPRASTILRSDGTTTEIAKPVRSRTRELSTIMLDALTDTMSQTQLTNLLAFLQQ
jgi:putative heme-binding domain-containing protein